MLSLKLNVYAIDMHFRFNGRCQCQELGVATGDYFPSEKATPLYALPLMSFRHSWKLERIILNSMYTGRNDCLDFFCLTTGDYPATFCLLSVIGSFKPSCLCPRL